MNIQKDVMNTKSTNESKICKTNKLIFDSQSQQIIRRVQASLRTTKDTKLTSKSKICKANKQILNLQSQQIIQSVQASLRNYKVNK